MTIVEQAPAFRDGGQNVDVRGAAREVLQRMGLEQAVRDRNTGERGVAWVDSANQTIARIDVDGMAGDGTTAELKILRGDLARLLYEATSTRATFRFGERVAAIAQNDAGARVTFKSGAEDQFDLVVIAEGVGSRTRDLVFPGESHPRWMGLATAFFTVPPHRDRQ